MSFGHQVAVSAAVFVAVAAAVGACLRSRTTPAPVKAGVCLALCAAVYFAMFAAWEVGWSSVTPGDVWRLRPSFRPPETFAERADRAREEARRLRATAEG